MKNAILVLTLFAVFSAMAVASVWRTPITRHMPADDDERAITELLIRHLDTRNHQDVEGFLATLHDDCDYMVTRNQRVGKEALAGMLPALWSRSRSMAQSPAGCMAWECFNQQAFPEPMLVNPSIQVSGSTARADLEYSAGPGLYLEANRFDLVRDFSGWKIKKLVRPDY